MKEVNLDSIFIIHTGISAFTLILRYFSYGRPFYDIITVRKTMKKLLSSLCTLSLLASIPFAYADIDDDLDDLRGTNRYSDWRMIKDDQRRNIKAYDKRDDQNGGVRSFKLDVIVDGSLETVARVYFDIENYTRWFWTVRESKLLKKFTTLSSLNSYFTSALLDESLVFNLNNYTTSSCVQYLDAIACNELHTVAYFI